MLFRSWQAIYDGNPPVKSVALTRYPQSSGELSHVRVLSDMMAIQNLVVDLRALRKDRGVPEKDRVSAIMFSSHADATLFENNLDLIQHLSKISKIDTAPMAIIQARPTHRSGIAWLIDLNYEATIDIPAERERLTKEIAKHEKNLASAESKLASEAFISKAPAHIVEGLKKQESENRQLLEKAKAALDALGC